MATIKDIAKKANVSPSSVSRILNKDSTLHVSLATKQRVLDIANELHYVKKGKKVNNNKRHSIGILHWYTMQQELEDPYYLTIRLGAENYCNEHNIQVKRTFRDDTNFKEHLQHINGLICIGKFSKQEVRSFYQIQKNIIFADMRMYPITKNSIILDFQQAMIDTIEYVLSQGHHKLTYLGGKEYTLDGSLYVDLRRTTFLEYCTLHTIEHRIVEDRFTIESGYELTKIQIKKGVLPDAFLCASDAIALGAMRACHEARIRIPQDISIIGFNDNANASYSTPPLTTIHAPSEIMGEYAAQIIHQQIGCIQKLPMQYVLPCTLIKRGSVKEKDQN